MARGCLQSTSSLPSSSSSSSGSGCKARVGAKPPHGCARPLCGCILVGVLYYFTMWYFVPALGIGSSKRPTDTYFDSIFSSSNALCNQSNGGENAWEDKSELKQVEWMVALWEASPMLGLREQDDPLVKEARRQLGSMSSAQGPHLQDCAAQAEEQAQVDSRDPLTSKKPVWSLWKGSLPRSVKDSFIHSLKGHIGLLDREVTPMEMEDVESEELLGDKMGLVWGPFPPWVEGADEDNLPMTRRAQRDLWLLQHPKNCSSEDVRFLVASWSNKPVHGFGGQIQHMAGMFAAALIDKRVLVTHDFAFGDHQGCQGADHMRWSCYFIPETTPECRKRAYELMEDDNALAEGRVLTDRDVLSQRDIWTVQPSLLWGTPWEHSQPTTEIEGKLLVIKHRTANVRWWRAQVIRYLMRYPSQHTCMLMNKARHEAFGIRAATNVVRFATMTWDKNVVEADMEKWVWKGQKPWVPRPLVSIHVRIGDRRWDMKIVDFPTYMDLARRLRNRFPHVEDVWLSTELQEVIDASKNYKGWNFYYTNIPRQQTRGVSMGSYLRSLGMEKATDMSFVNFLMACDADYFVGALGSTWCYLIDGMRSTGGKQMAGYLSVNIDRHWKKRRRA